MEQDGERRSQLVKIDHLAFLQLVVLTDQNQRVGLVQAVEVLREKGNIGNTGARRLIQALAVVPRVVTHFEELHGLGELGQDILGDTIPAVPQPVHRGRAEPLCQDWARNLRANQTQYENCSDQDRAWPEG